MPQKIIISTDSASDLNDLFAKRDIREFPLHVILGDKDYFDDIDIKPNMIFDYYRETGKLPKTAARSFGDFYDYFKAFTDEGYAVIHIAISSKISSTYENAAHAAKDLSGVYVIDGLSLSSGTGLLALYAAKLRDDGASAEDIATAVTARVNSVQASFMINTLDFLHKGGRCSGLAAIVGKAFSIKPTLQLIDGNITVARKMPGKFEKNILKYVDFTLAKYNTPDMGNIFITHTSASAEVVAAVRQKLRDYGFADENIHETIAGSTITSHCGKSTLGILYINDGNKQ